MANTNIIVNSKGQKIVQINNVIFLGKQNIDWKLVEQYAKKYINEAYTVSGDGECINIGNDFPDEFSHSKDTERLRGGSAKAKANAIQGLPELIEISGNRRYKENYGQKHKENAKYGWYRYDARFSLPVYENDKIERFNVYLVTMLVRHAANHKKYLYDVVNIKKETEYPA